MWRLFYVVVGFEVPALRAEVAAVAATSRMGVFTGKQKKCATERPGAMCVVSVLLRR